MGTAFKGKVVIDENTGIAFQGKEIAGTAYMGDVIYLAPEKAPAEILPTSVSISASGSTTLRRGQSVPVTAIVLPENAANKAVTWESGNAVTVTPTGENTATVTGVGSGMTTVRATTSNGLRTDILFQVRAY